ncbi:MAG: divergent PAP2 family protein [Oscillospiraceae bacterium]|nr:divergent PAP2 family protein [Oscillospiraceae bacterium]
MDFFEQISNNSVLIATFLAWAISCILKGLIVCIRERKFNIGRFMGPGGMPSSHSAIVAALSVSVGRVAGFDSPAFAITAALSLIVMYDASGIRRAAGKQAEMINAIVEAWNEKDPLRKQIKLKELLGHTPVEVFAGAVLGVIVAVLMPMTTI